MKISKHFTVKEFVNPDIVNKLGEIRAANIISPHLIKQVELLRAQFGPITINNYEWGGKYKNSGIRKANYYKNALGMIRNSYSTHLFCNTADLKFKDYTAEEVYDYILANKEKFPNIVRMENAHKTITWLHIECGKYRENKIGVFNP